MNANHTPGPWVFCEEGTGFLTIRGGSPDYRGDIASIHVSKSEERDIADARLISLAPEMLAALENLAFIVGDDTYPVGSVGSDAIATARSILARAKGA